jgi:hypothetical protein
MLAQVVVEIGLVLLEVMEASARVAVAVAVCTITEIIGAETAVQASSSYDTLNLLEHPHSMV